MTEPMGSNQNTHVETAAFGCQSMRNEKALDRLLVTSYCLVWDELVCDEPAFA